MLIAIFSDSHDNILNIEKFLDWVKANDVAQLIFCGDLCAPATLKKVIAPRFPGPIHMVFGNVTDRELLPKVAATYDQVTHYGDIGEVQIDGIKIGFVHFPQEAKNMAETGVYDFVFYGHTHKPWDEMIGNSHLANPGTLAGLFYKATFAVFDTETKNLELIIVERI